MNIGLIALLHLGVVLAAIFHALLCKRDHRVTLAWVAVILLFPLVGPVLYLLFGINRLRTLAKQATGLAVSRLHLGEERPATTFTDHHDPLCPDTPEPWLAGIGGRVCAAPLSQGNSLEMLENGETFYQRLVQTIDQAQSYLLLSSYIFSADKAGIQIVNALQRAAARGLRVYVMIDGIGVMYSRTRVVQRLRKAGAEVALFLPPRLTSPGISLNLRNHRKIAIADGNIGFFGGMNIDQRHMVDDPHTPNPTRDIQFVASGPVVHELQQLFVFDWQIARGEIIDQLAEPTASSGDALCRVIRDGPDESLDYLSMTLNSLFSAARHSITLVVPYFLPAREMIVALQSAVVRGVRVRVILPERSNLPMVDWASRKMLWELLVWKVEVYYQPTPFDHSKLILIDSHYAMGGSANLDARSLRLNFEVGVEILGGQVNQSLRTQVNQLLAKSRRLDLQELDRRNVLQKVRDAFCWLFSSYL